MGMMDAWEMRGPEASERTEFEIAAIVLGRFLNLKNEIRTKRYGSFVALVFRLCVKKEYQREGMEHFSWEKERRVLRLQERFYAH